MTQGVYTDRGVAKAKLGKHSDAIADFNAAIQINPDDAGAYSNRGIAKAELGQTWAAKQDLRTALRLATQARRCGTEKQSPRDFTSFRITQAADKKTRTQDLIYLIFSNQRVGLATMTSKKYFCEFAPSIRQNG